jgi:hypothetical protein
MENAHFRLGFSMKKPSLKGHRSGAQAAGQCEGPLGPWSRCESTLEDGSQQPQGGADDGIGLF